MKKLLASSLLIFILASGCSKKKDIIYECTFVTSFFTTVEVITVSPDYKTIKENYSTMYVEESNEERAKIYAETTKASHPKADVIVNGNKVQVIMDYMDDYVIEMTEERLNALITMKEAMGYTCELLEGKRSKD